MREPFQKRDPDTVRRFEMKDVNFRDFLVYRYARPERLGHRTPGNKLINAALLAARDPKFPNTASFDEIAHHISTDPLYAEGSVYTIRHIRKAFHEYQDWLSMMKARLNRA